MAEEGFDYSTLARHGEVKKTKSDSLTPPAGRPSTGGDYHMPKPATQQDHPSDLSPHGGIIQRRKRDNVIAPIPSGTQQNIEGHEVSTNFTRRGRTPFNGTDTYIMESIEHHGEPFPKTRTKALRHLHKRSAEILKEAEKKSKGQETPPEH